MIERVLLSTPGERAEPCRSKSRIPDMGNDTNLIKHYRIFFCPRIKGIKGIFIEVKLEGDTELVVSVVRLWVGWICGSSSASSP